MVSAVFISNATGSSSLAGRAVHPPSFQALVGLPMLFEHLFLLPTAPLSAGVLLFEAVEFLLGAEGFQLVVFQSGIQCDKGDRWYLNLLPFFIINVLYSATYFKSEFSASSEGLLYQEQSSSAGFCRRRMAAWRSAAAFFLSGGLAFSRRRAQK